MTRYYIQYPCHRLLNSLILDLPTGRSESREKEGVVAGASRDDGVGDPSILGVRGNQQQIGGGVTRGFRGRSLSKGQERSQADLGVGIHPEVGRHNVVVLSGG